MGENYQCDEWFHKYCVRCITGMTGDFTNIVWCITGVKCEQNLTQFLFFSFFLRMLPPWIILQMIILCQVFQSQQIVRNCAIDYFHGMKWLLILTNSILDNIYQFTFNKLNTLTIASTHKSEDPRIPTSTHEPEDMRMQRCENTS